MELKIREQSLPTNGSLEQLSSFLADFYSKNVISRARLEHAYALFASFRQKLNAKYPSRYHVNMCGSMTHGICFNDSQCDISIEPNMEFMASEANKTNTTNGTSHSVSLNSMNIMRDVVELIRSEMADVFVSVENDAEYMRNNKARGIGPGASAERGHTNSANRVVFRSIASSSSSSTTAASTTSGASSNSTNENGGIVFNFLTGLYPSAHKTSTLLRAYFDLDERARVLAFCFRYLAKVRIFYLN